jgi:hypothetical protein
MLKGGEGTPGVVERDPVFDDASSMEAVLQFYEIDVLLLQRPPVACPPESVPARLSESSWATFRGAGQPVHFQGSRPISHLEKLGEGAFSVKGDFPLTAPKRL